MKPKDTLITERSGNVLNEGFDSLYWLLQARTTDQGNRHYNLNGILFQDGFGITTDGHRLHLCDFNDHEEMCCAPEYEDSFFPDELNGFYEVAKITKKQIVLKPTKTAFPDWPLAFPAHKNYQELSFIWRDNPSGAYSNIVRMLRNNVTINFKFFSEACLPHENWTAYVYRSLSLSMVGLQNSNKLALIMGLKC